MSGGEAHALRWSCLINDPAVLIADEPTVNLDSAFVGRCWRCWANWRCKGEPADQQPRSLGVRGGSGEPESSNCTTDAAVGTRNADHSSPSSLLQLIALSAGTVLPAAGFAGRSCATGTSTAAANYS
ncbi:MAG: hypothetical protein R3F40_05030 [Candidatus Competibacteraceae bacterium]